MLVREMIEKLQRMPRDEVLVICDADTGWYMHVAGVEHVTAPADEFWPPESVAPRPFVVVHPAGYGEIYGDH